MSAYVVGKEHIDALITAALAYGDRGRGMTFYHRPADGHLRCLTVDGTNADEIGRMLWAENIKSVQARYGDDLTELPGPIPMPDPTAQDWYVYPLFKRPLSAVAALKALAGYEYQSCEHDEWNGSPARAFCEALRSAAIAALPGYEDAEWEVSA